MFALLGNKSEWYYILNAIPEYIAIQKCSTRAQTSVHWQAHSSNCTLAPKKLHALNAHSTETFNTVWILFYGSDGLKTDFATTKLAATINVWNTTPSWNGITLIAVAQFFWMSVSWYTIYYRMPIPKLELSNGIFCVCSRKLVSCLLRAYSHRQSMLILKADFCIFGFVYDKAIGINQCKQHKNPNN